MDLIVVILEVNLMHFTQMNPFSRIISGTMTWGAWGAKMSTVQMQRQIENYLSMGITTFDHADIYGGYTTEAEFGAAFSRTSIPREQLQFITKCGIQMPCEARPMAVKHYDYSSDHIQKSVENSLKALQTDYIDLLLFHRPSPLLNVETAAQIIQKLLEEGKIKSFGVSNFTPAQIALLQKALHPSWNQIECSLTHENSLFDGTIDYLSTHKIGVMAWSPLGSFFKEKNSRVIRIKQVMGSLCEKYDCSEDQLLLAWLAQHPSQIHPVVGTTSAQRMKNAISALEIKLELTDWFLLLKASQGVEVP